MQAANKTQCLLSGLRAAARGMLLLWLSDATAVLAQAMAQRSPLPFIATGLPVEPSQFSFVVSVQLGGGHYCTGALIRADWVVTSAHCVEHHKTPGLVRLGDKLQSGHGTLLKVKKILRHPAYQHHNLLHDIALLQLADAATAEFQPLQLPTATVMAQLVYPGAYLTTASWGAFNARGEAADQLLQQSLPLRANSECNQPTAYQGAVQPSMLCAGFAHDNTDNCVADRGAPLVGQYRGVNYSIGVASWGSNCQQDMTSFALIENDTMPPTSSANYSIFSSSWFYLDWIQRQLPPAP